MAEVRTFAERIRDGDGPTWEALSTEFYPRLLGHAMRRLHVGPRDPRLPEVIQEIWVRALEQRTTFQGCDDDTRTRFIFIRWLDQVARTATLNTLRKQKAGGSGILRRAVSLSETPSGNSSQANGPPPPRARDSTPSKKLGRAEEASKILAQLTRPKRLLVRLHLYEGLDYKDIAEVFGDTPAQVRERFNDIMKELRGKAKGKQR